MGIEIILTVLFLVFCYWLGGLLMPEFKPIQQELIRFEEE